MSKVKMDTRALKAQREKMLEEFLEEIKDNGQWKRWLSPKGKELYIAEICREMGRLEGLRKHEKGVGNENKPWAADCFRGTGWAVRHKEAFNKWVRVQLRKELENPERGMNGTKKSRATPLPPWVNFRKLEQTDREIAAFIIEQAEEISGLNKQIAELEYQLETKDRKLREQQTQLESIKDFYCAHDDHYKKSIRSLIYED